MPFLFTHAEHRARAMMLGVTMKGNTILTLEEHIGRCMLLGDTWEFNRGGFYYFDTSTASHVRVRLDAETMEEISENEAYDRRMRDYGYSKFKP